MLNFLKRKFKTRTARAYKRLDCMRLSSMRSSGNSANQFGITVDISNGGALFRPAKEFMTNRNGESIVLQIGALQTHEVRGIVVSTTHRGYHVRFDTLIENELVEDIAAEMDIDPHKFSAA